MAWDEQAYYQDPYEQNGGWAENWDGQGQWGKTWDDQGQYGEEEEESESNKLRIFQEAKEKQDTLELNKLYLRKILKGCAFENFKNLEKLQLFLFEVLVESLEVGEDGGLGIVGSNEQSLVAARARFLDSPYLEIVEKEVPITKRLSQESWGEADYLQAVGEAGLQQAGETRATSVQPQPLQPQQPAPDNGELASMVLTEDKTEADDKDNVGEEEQDQSGVEETDIEYTSKWERASGKSCLFAMTALQMIQDLARYPMELQVARLAAEQGVCEPVGYARVRLPQEFSLTTIQSTQEGVALPVSAIHRYSGHIRDVFGKRTGRVELFLRLSAFGPAIVTSFQTDNGGGTPRSYVFKPSPVSEMFHVEPERTPPPLTDTLKPIFSEEERVIGISVMKEYDIFQKPVIWRSKYLDYLPSIDESRCKCLNELTRDASMASFSPDGMPKRDHVQGCDQQYSQSLSNVGFENCGCTGPEWMDPMVAVRLKSKNEAKRQNVDRKTSNDQLSYTEPHMSSMENKPKANNTSQPYLVPRSYMDDNGFPIGDYFQRSFFPRPVGFKNETSQGVPSSKTDLRPTTRLPGYAHQDKNPFGPLPKGFGITPEMLDCGCDCPTVRDILNTKKLFLI